MVTGVEYWRNVLELQYQQRWDTKKEPLATGTPKSTLEEQKSINLTKAKEITEGTIELNEEIKAVQKADKRRNEGNLNWNYLNRKQKKS